MKKSIIRMRFFFMLLIGLSLLVVGCRSAPTGKLVKDEKFLFVETPPGLKISIVKKEGSLAKFCAPREADFAFTGSEGADVSAQVPLNGTSDGVGESATNGALSLGGRDPEVLMLREVLFRACELSYNYNFSAQEAVSLYLSFLRVVNPMLETQSSQAGTGVTGMDGAPVTLPNLLEVPPSNQTKKADNRKKITCKWKNTSALQTCTVDDYSCGDYKDENDKTCVK